MANRESKNSDNKSNEEAIIPILKDILELQKEHQELQKEHQELQKERLYFRGESSYYEMRTPSLYLEEKLTMDSSEYYYRALLSELGRDDYQENTSLVRLISELQHYGAKTRMLDITSNPLVALYFAVEKDNGEPGFLFVYKSKICEEKFDTGHTVAIKSALNFMPKDVINDFLDGVDSLKDKTEINNLEYVQLEELEEKLKDICAKKELENFIITATKFMEVLNQRARVRERLIYPFKIFSDLQKAHIVIPSKTTDRIRQQQGAFIYPRYVSSNNNTSYETIKEKISDSINKLSVSTQTNTDKQSFLVIKIDSGCKETIRHQLELLGITEGFIYQDVEHQSKTLLNK